MQLYQLKPIHKFKHSKRVGRGGKRGTYSGRGVKGQMSRAGRKPRPGFAGGATALFKQLPKQRGVGAAKKIKMGVKLFRLRRDPVVLNIEKLDKFYKEGQKVSPKTLANKGLIARIRGRMPKVKILGKGQLTKKINFQGIYFSKNAKNKISQK